MSVSTEPLSEAPVAVNARIAARYDDVPYRSYPRSRSHPSRIAMVARLLGHDPAPLADARLLEIGCASGGHIIPLAAEYPNGRFVGVDLSPVQIAQGRARIERLGLANIELIEGDVAEFAPRREKFDFILCHGVYSWVPPHVREAILKLIANNLSPAGVAYVSYNVLPGWRHKQVLRDALMSQVGGIADAKAQVAEARVILEALKGWNSGKGPHAAMLRHWAAKADESSDDYIAHEYLSNDNEPLTFSAFVAEAERASLGYLGELDLWMTLPENFDPEIQRVIEATSGGRLLKTEQMIDILTGREFRRTLLASADVCKRLPRAFHRDRIGGLHFFGRYERVEPADAPAPWSFAGVNGRKLSTNIPSVAAALDALTAAHPASMPLDDLIGASSLETQREVADALFRALAGGMVDARMDPIAAASATPERPIVPAHCRSDAAAGEDAVVTLMHQPFFLDAVTRILMPLLDGSRDKLALERALIEAASAGRLRFHRDDALVTAEADIADCAKEHVERALEALRAAGLTQPA
ncbi:MAG TPA: class I SAM-dependent methyltransferase [Roseiarcus sp.]|nr:class I SAM-dependent methyltransferase [Roseiarcus sp.]